MKDEVFAELLESANEALGHAQGKQELRTTILPGAPRLMSASDVRALRQRLNASQSVFAHFLNVSTKLVQAWESNRRRPDGAALRLLELAQTEPHVVFRGLTFDAASASRPLHSTAIRSLPTATNRNTHRSNSTRTSKRSA